MDQESIQQSFPSTTNDNNRKEASINSHLNNNDNSSSVPSATNNPSTNDNSKPPESKKVRSRRIRKVNSSTGRPMRNKIVKESKESSIKNKPYTIPYSTRSQTQLLRQQVSSTLAETASVSTIVNSNANAAESINSNTVNPQVPIAERKKYCSKCKESASIAKIINSKMDKIEELVRNLKKVTDEISKNNILSQSPSSATANKTFNSFRGIDFSRMSISDLQNFVMVVTNTIMTTTNVVKSEFEGSQFLKIETPQ